MATGTAEAVTQAARLDEIGFPEFTAKLIKDTFDALVAANISQTQAYLELVAAVASTLTEYINKTKDDIDGAQILQFLAANLPAPDNEAGTTVVDGAKLSSDQAGTLNEALTIVKDDGTATNNDVVKADQALDDSALSLIYDAVANRIAANKYTLLKEMVKQGILRLVVEQGVIETRLTFTTYGSSYYSKNSSSYNRSEFALRARARTGGLLSPWVKASASTSYTNVSVRTTKESQRDISGSRVQIFGRVEINFKTDYLPLT